MANISMLGTGLIGMFYTKTLHGLRSRDRVQAVYSRTEEHASDFAEQWNVPAWSTNMEEVIHHPDTEVVVIGLPNNLHEAAVEAACEAGKAVLCTKPLARSAGEAKRILDTAESAGVFHGYLEDLVYTPKTRKALESAERGVYGRILWTRSRETHPGPHSEWFWNPEISGGGAIIDLGCHCIEIGRNFIGKDIRPVEVVCWADTQVHPIEAEDSAVGLVRYANGAMGQFEVSWNFRGGMDLRDEVSGTKGTVWLNHWLRTGFEAFTSGESSGYVSEKSEAETGWVFPVGDEEGALGYVEMFADMLNSLEEGREPRETFYDGYVVNAIMDAVYRSVQSRQWESIELEEWRGKEEVSPEEKLTEYDSDYLLVKREKMPDGKTKLILKEKESGSIVEKVRN